MEDVGGWGGLGGVEWVERWLNGEYRLENMATVRDPPRRPLPCLLNPWNTTPHSLSFEQKQILKLSYFNWNSITCVAAIVE